MTIAWLLLAAGPSLVPQECVSPSARIALDHVVVGVRDLDEASRTYEGLGFTFKDGRLHANGLKNRHVKFGNLTSVELMSVVGDPGDDMASAYQTFISHGEGGVYLALLGDQAAVARAAREVGLEPSPLSVGGFQYVTFESPGLQGVFTVEYASRPKDPAALLTHANGAQGIRMVWLEGSEELGALLIGLGGVRCARTELPDGRTGIEYGISGGSVVIVEPAGPRLEVLGIRIATTAARRLLRPERAHRVWLELAPET